jgi:hypothetical protein
MRKDITKNIVKEISSKYLVQEITISIKNIDEFVLVENKRKLRKCVVQSVKRNLLKGESFDSPIIINMKDNKKRILDGQHRITAIREVLNLSNKFKIKVLCLIYKDLSRLEERKIFTKWNSGSKQSSDDLLMIHIQEFPIYEMITKDFPVKVEVYSEPGSLKFRLLLGAYLYASKNPNGGRLAMILSEAPKLDKKDYSRLKEYIEGYIKFISSDLTFKNLYIHNVPFSAIMKCYFTTKLDKDEFWKKIKSAIKDEKFVMLCKLSGDAALSLCVNTLKTMIGDLKYSISKIMENKDGE